MRARSPAQCLVSLAEAARTAVSVGHNWMVLDQRVSEVVASPLPDTVAIIDVRSLPPRLPDEIEMPGSESGPLLSVAVAPDESIAIVTAALKISPADPASTVPNHRMTVIDLTQLPPRAIGTPTTGASPTACRSIGPARWRWSPAGPTARCRSAPSRARPSRLRARWRSAARRTAARATCPSVRTGAAHCSRADAAQRIPIEGEASAIRTAE